MAQEYIRSVKDLIESLKKFPEDTKIFITDIEEERWEEFLFTVSCEQIDLPEPNINEDVEKYLEWQNNPTVDDPDSEKVILFKILENITSI